ncbi:DNA topoisomerase [Roseburia sp. AM59-24XD]|jgi:DNA topoisomerase-3|uniref:DNA topoisomerase n=1 Tax=Roseburia sp. AM59-24XD TaxID=2293138 RepID=UPI000E545137|nr:DNA topoisomerase [Roseburia sp. AM59-24XD]RHP85297.1 type IA DNA topoisomerase [Roseburia sp. AM59-24XD]
MGKKLFIAEKPSVAREFAKTLGVNGNAGNGYLESNDYVVTWCVGHLVTMSYPEVYDPALKKWSLNTIPFMPDEFLYELIPDVRKQFNIVKGLLNRPDVERIYVCTDSGREGEYIYRLVDQMAEVPDTKDKRRVWIDSQTEEEILRGIREAKPLSEYDNLAASAYLRAKEDYLMGINFSRVLSLKYSQTIMNYRKGAKYAAIAVGRVMTCVLGMVVRREREIRSFVKTPFYRVIGHFSYEGKEFDGEWRSVDGSDYYQSPKLYKENGFKERTDAAILCQNLGYPKEDGDGCFLPEPPAEAGTAVVEKIERKKEKKNPPLLFNLAELQNVCSKLFKISPDETLKIVQELYEKKLVTYPRTDARVLSTAVSKEIHKNIGGLRNYPIVREIAEKILSGTSYQKIASTRYCDDKKITDHYAIIPTGQGFGALKSTSLTTQRVYEVIVRRFLCIFYPPAEYQKISLTAVCGNERFFSGIRIMLQQGYLEIADASFSKKKQANRDADAANADNASAEEEKDTFDEALIALMKQIRKGTVIDLNRLEIKEGETSPPKRYNSGSLILAMENAGQLIEDEELRSQIKGSGIGTSATRAEILSKLVTKKYLKLNKKTQIITPEFLGEMVYDVVDSSIRSLLNPELTASWEKGLTYMAEGTITEEEYMKKLENYIAKWVNGVKGLNNQSYLRKKFDEAAVYYKK